MISTFPCWWAGCCCVCCIEEKIDSILKSHKSERFKFWLTANVCDISFSLSLALSLFFLYFSFFSALEPIRKQIEFLSFENSPPIRRHWFEVVKQENQAEIFFLLLNLSWICQLIKFGSSSLLVLNPLVETTFQLEHETQLPLWCKGVKKEEEKFPPFLQIKFKHQFRLYFYLFYNIEWLNQHIIDVVNRLFATSTTR